MNKQTRFVFFVLVALVAILAASTSFFAAKTYKNSAKKSQPSSNASSSIGGEATNEGSAKPTTSSSSQVTKAASTVEKPSKPTDTYVVQKGETLFVVAQSQGVNWQDLAEANGITDADKIQADQTLIVPKGGEVDFTLDNTRATSLQKDAEGGKYQFRLSPEETARSDAPPCYGIQVADDFVLKSNDNGSAQVQVSIDSKNYLIKLTQPITKGEKGIWAIESIKPV